jgi:hypothetical protein
MTAKASEISKDCKRLVATCKRIRDQVVESRTNSFPLQGYEVEDLYASLEFVEGKFSEIRAEIARAFACNHVPREHYGEAGCKNPSTSTWRKLNIRDEVENIRRCDDHFPDPGEGWVRVP